MMQHSKMTSPEIWKAAEIFDKVFFTYTNYPVRILPKLKTIFRVQNSELKWFFFSIIINIFGICCLSVMILGTLLKHPIGALIPPWKLIVHLLMIVVCLFQLLASLVFFLLDVELIRKLIKDVLIIEQELRQCKKFSFLLFLTFHFNFYMSFLDNLCDINKTFFSYFSD